MWLRPCTWVWGHCLRCCVCIVWCMCKTDWFGIGDSVLAKHTENWPIPVPGWCIDAVQPKRCHVLFAADDHGYWRGEAFTPLSMWVLKQPPQTALKPCLVCHCQLFYLLSTSCKCDLQWWRKTFHRIADPQCGVFHAWRGPYRPLDTDVVFFPHKETEQHYSEMTNLCLWKHS